MNFCQLSVQLGNFHKLLSTFHAHRRASVEFSCGRETFCQLLSNFCVDGRSSVNFNQLFVRP